jgi:hypothetical protein
MQTVDPKLASINPATVINVRIKPLPARIKLEFHLKLNEIREYLNITNNNPSIAVWTALEDIRNSH